MDNALPTDVGNCLPTAAPHRTGCFKSSKVIWTMNHFQYAYEKPKFLNWQWFFGASRRFAFGLCKKQCWKYVAVFYTDLSAACQRAWRKTVRTKLVVKMPAVFRRLCQLCQYCVFGGILYAALGLARRWHVLIFGEQNFPCWFIPSPLFPGQSILDLWCI